MKNKLRLLAVAGIFMSTSANAATSITSAEIQSYGQVVVDYLTQNSTTLQSTYGMTAADLQSVQSAYSSIATSTQFPINIYNNTLQSSAGCAGLGTFPDINMNNYSTCAMDMVTALTNSGYTDTPALFGGGIALAKAAGMPLTIPGTNVSVPLTSPVTPPVIEPVIPPVTEPTTQPTTHQAAIAEVVSEVVTPLVQRATSVQQATIISNVVSNIFSTRASARPGAQIRMSFGGESLVDEKGMAAGDSPAKLNAWLNASETQIGNSSAASSLSGNVSNVLGGVDYMFSPELVAGVSLGYDRVSIDYNFIANSGLASEGWMVAPYASYRISDMISVDGAYGYASGDADGKAIGVVTTQGYTRNFFTLNLNGDYWMGDWQLTGKANYISAEEKAGITNKMEQLRLGAQVGYWMEGVMPYAGLTYVNDLKVSSSVVATTAQADKEAWVAAIGVNLFSKGAIYGGVSYTHEFARADSKNDTLMANIGYRF